jgi:hypothetical protein
MLFTGAEEQIDVALERVAGARSHAAMGLLADLVKVDAMDDALAAFPKALGLGGHVPSKTLQIRIGRFILHFNLSVPMPAGFRALGERIVPYAGRAAQRKMCKITRQGLNNLPR